MELVFYVTTSVISYMASLRYRLREQNGIWVVFWNYGHLYVDEIGSRGYNQLVHVNLSAWIISHSEGGKPQYSGDHRLREIFRETLKRDVKITRGRVSAEGLSVAVIVVTVVTSVGRQQSTRIQVCLRVCGTGSLTGDAGSTSTTRSRRCFKIYHKADRSISRLLRSSLL